MHPRLEALFAGLDAHRATLVDAVEAAPAALRQHRPVPDRWSVAEILEHLAIVENRVARILTTTIAEGRAAGVGVEDDASPPALRRRVAAILDRTRRVAAPAVLEPRSGMSIDVAWTALGQSRDRLRAAALTGDGLALGTLTHPHPFVGPLTLYEWIAFVGVHEARHAAQIREIAGV